MKHPETTSDRQGPEGTTKVPKEPFRGTTSTLVAMTVPEAIEPAVKPAAGGVKEKTRNKWFRNVRKQPPVGKVPKGLPPKAVSPEGTQSAVGNRASGRHTGAGFGREKVPGGREQSRRQACPEGAPTVFHRCLHACTPRRGGLAHPNTQEGSRPRLARSA